MRAGDFGEAIALSGNLLIVGEPAYDNEVGAAFIYARAASGAWRQQTKLTYVGSGSSNAGFGSSVAVSGATVAVAAPAGYVNRGVVFVYGRSGSSWSLQSRLLGPPSSTGGVSLLGESLSLSGDSLTAGLFATSRNSARGYVFVRSGVKWHEQGLLTTPPGKPSDTQYGTSLAISGNRILIGDPLPNPHQCGAAYEYIRTRTGWHKRAKLVNPGCAPNDQFGAALALSGQTALIGAPGYDNSAGQAYVQTIP